MVASGGKLRICKAEPPVLDRSHGKCADRMIAGGKCYGNAGCERGLGCVNGACIEFATAGTRAKGAPCISTKDCVPGLTCATVNGEKVCAGFNASGADCMPFDQIACGDGEKCIANKCSTAMKAGDPCSGSTVTNGCLVGLVCAGQLGEKICLAPVLPGEACSTDDGCKGIDSVCTSGVCTISAIAGIGGACVPKSKHKLGLFGFGCEADLLCDPQASVCRTAPKVNETCVEGQCGLEMHCNMEGNCSMFRKSDEN